MEKCICCFNCHATPAIKHLFFNERWIIQYECGCGNYSIQLEKFIKLFAVSSHLDIKSQDKCLYHKFDIKKYCKDCRTFLCLTCIQTHNYHKIVDINDFYFSNSYYKEIKRKFSFATQSITNNMSKEKDKMLTIITNKIEELQKDNETLIKAYEKNCQINHQLNTFIQCLFENYDTSKSKQLHYVNLLNIGKFNLLYKEAYNSNQENTDIYQYDYLDYPEKEIYEDKLKRKQQKLELTVHQQCQQFINKCKNTFIITKENSYLTGYKYYTYQPFGIKSYFIMDELEFLYKNLKFNDDKKIIITKSLVIDEKRFAIYGSTFLDMLIINTKSKCIEKELQYRENPHQLPNIFQLIVKIDDSKCLLFNGSQTGFLYINNRKYPFKKIHYIRGVFYFALQLKNKNTVLSSDFFIYIYDFQFNHQKLIKRIRSEYNIRAILECGHENLIVLNKKFISFYETKTYQKVHEYEFYCDSMDIIKMISKNKFIYLPKQTEYYMTTLYLYNCCPFQMETIIELQDGGIKYCDFYDIDDAIILTINNSVYSMDKRKYEKSKLFIVNNFYKIECITPLPNRQLALIGDDGIVYYNY